MILRENPVLLRELLVNLRAPRAFVLQFLYVCALALMVFLAWPNWSRDSVLVGAAASARLFNLFFIGQLLLVAVMAPTFAAGSVTNEKERKTYEMLLASPLRPSAILFGKLLSSVTFLVLLIVSTVPVVMLCYLLGGILLSEIVVSYVVLILSAVTFGMLALGCSSLFARTSSALVVSYLVILPLAALLIGVMTNADPVTAQFFMIALLPPWSLALWLVLGLAVNRRLLRPPDLGSEGKEVVDELEEQRPALGVVIDRNAFPDYLFAPAKREDLMPDGANPVLDKELRSEIFSQGTLMLRVVIQVSMFLSVVFMFAWLFINPESAGYYVGYVVTFNLLVGPVFSSGSVTQERERKTMALLLTTLLRPGRILYAKLLASLRVSTVLTLLLTEQIVLAYVLVVDYWATWWTFFVFIGIIVATCLTTTTVGLFASTLARRTAVAMIVTYLILSLLFFAPLGVFSFTQAFYPDVNERNLRWLLVASPYTAALDVPAARPTGANPAAVWRLRGAPLPGTVLPIWAVYLLIQPAISIVLYLLTMAIFRYKWWRAGATL